MDTLDITREHCPMTFVKTKLRLSKMQKGDQLEILLGTGEPLDNVPKSIREQGDKVLSITELEESVYRVVVEKC